MSATSARRSGFSVIELLVVISVIAVLAGILLAALSGVWSSGRMTDSTNRMRQIGTMMREYAIENRDQILPSQFNYANDPRPGKVRQYSSPAIGEQHKGTWTDILWVTNNLGAFPEAESTLGHDYRYDSPDQALYDLMGEYEDNPLRAAELNSQDTIGGGDPTPWGKGAQGQSLPGYFAANQFFNADAESSTFNGWWSMGQIKVPAKSMYLMDSWGGETIEDEPAYYLTDMEQPESLLQVDFRYNDLCLMLFLDGHVSPEARWPTLESLETKRTIRVRCLDRKSPGPCN